MNRKPRNRKSQTFTYKEIKELDTTRERAKTAVLMLIWILTFVVGILVSFATLFNTFVNIAFWEEVEILHELILTLHDDRILEYSLASGSPWSITLTFIFQVCITGFEIIYLQMPEIKQSWLWVQPGNRLL